MFDEAHSLEEAHGAGVLDQGLQVAPRGTGLDDPGKPAAHERRRLPALPTAADRFPPGVETTAAPFVIG